jgi:UDP-N-acetylmuramoyl-L-alanyl-D-glutamate--2,6-diaminopimelate ligase
LARAGHAALQALSDRFGADSVRAWDDSDAARKRLPSWARIADVSDNDAALRGVQTIVKSPGVPIDHRLLLEARHRGLVVIDELELGWRLSKQPLIAVTGTNGKSTTSALIAAALRGDRQDVALAGNVEAVQGGRPLSALSPEQRGWIVAEVSSYQAVGLTEMLPDVGVFTNLTPDHLHWHGSMQAYCEAKSRVFFNGSRCVKLAVLNYDDPLGRNLESAIRERGGQTLGYGWRTDADYRIEACEWSANAGRIVLSTPNGALKLDVSLPGTHNAANIAAAIATADGIGLARERSLPAILATPAPPGRLERIDAGQDFELFVDFAHSPDSVHAVLATLSAIARDRGGQLIAVLGLPVGAPASRRECGRVARAGCDRLILDAWSLRGEPPLLALAALRAGAREVEGATLHTALDRRTAISNALSLAKPGDVVAILGRGPLNTIAWDRHVARVPFDDRQIARELLLSDEPRKLVDRPEASAAVV